LYAYPRAMVGGLKLQPATPPLLHLFYGPTQ
jgi:hypothetical protein